MHRWLRAGVGITFGRVLATILSWVFGLGMLSALGLVMTGHVWLALLIAVVGFLLYDGLTRLLLGRRRRAH
jgi:hypothetical protein